MKENFEYESGKEYLTMYVTKEFKEMWEQSQDKRKLFDEYIVKRVEDVRKDLRYSVECLDEDALIFKATAIKYKQQYEQVCNEVKDEVCKLWENMDVKNHESLNKIKSISTEMKKVEDDIRSLDKSLQSVSTYRLDRLLEIIEKVSNMGEKERKIFNFLIENKGEWI